MGQAESLKMFAQVACGFGECARAVADCLFYLVGQFAEGLRVAFGDEDGVVAEAPRAARRVCDASFAHTVERFDEAGRGVCERDDTDEARASVAVARGREFFEESLHAFAVS